jgi:hypothetical protein
VLAAGPLDRSRVGTHRRNLREEEHPLGRLLANEVLGGKVVMLGQLVGPERGEIGGDTESQTELVFELFSLAPEHRFAQARKGVGRNVCSARRLAGSAVKRSL